MFLKSMVSAILAALLLTGNAIAAPTAPAVSPAPSAPAASAAPIGEITAQEAESIALTHAGFTAQEVTNLRSRKDLDDRVPEWEVEFRQEDWEYDYTIHRETGALLEWDKDYEPKKTMPAAPAPAAPSPTDPAGPITAQEAEAIALTHAGFTAGEVKGLRSKLDRDDGISVYEVEFRSGRWEYEYEIHAETGAILSHDRDD